MNGDRVLLDTSALAKQFIEEVGTGEALALRTDAPPHATATIAYTETFSAFRRHVREAALKERQYHEVVRRFVQEWPAYVRINLDESILGRSRTLLERYPLRTLEAIHLASAIELQISWTNRLLLSQPAPTHQSCYGRTSRNETYPLVNPCRQYQSFDS
jgi:hypothetical protein